MRSGHNNLSAARCSHTELELNNFLRLRESESIFPRSVTCIFRVIALQYPRGKMRFVIYTIYCIFMSKTHTGNHTATVVTGSAKRDQCSACGHYMCVCVSTIEIAKEDEEKR